MTPRDLKCSLCGMAKSPLVSNSKSKGMVLICLECLKECSNNMLAELFDAELIKYDEERGSVLRMLRPEVVLDIFHADSTIKGKPAAVIASKFASITPSSILALIEGFLELVEIEIEQNKSV